MLLDADFFAKICRFLRNVAICLQMFAYFSDSDTDSEHSDTDTADSDTDFSRF